MILNKLKYMALPALLLVATPNYAAEFSASEIKFSPKGHPYNLKKSQGPLHLHLTADAGHIKEHHLALATPIPASFDVTTLVHNYPAPFDQGNLGSCTANALDGLVTFVHLMEGLPVEEFSRLFIYYNERKLEGDIEEDSGASLSTGIHSLCKYGVCNENLWSYSDDTEKFKIQPPATAYADAVNNVILDRVSLDRLHQSLSVFKYTLAVLQRPFVLGIQIYESFESAEVAQTGIVPMPNVETEECQGGHAVLAVGYDDAKQTFKIRNSWGPDWGDNGYFYLPYAFVTDPNLAVDFWTISKIGKRKS